MIAFLQILFGAAGTELAYQSGTSNIATQLSLEENLVRQIAPDYHSNLWETVDRWHKRTVSNARIWCESSGAALLILVTIVRLQLWQIEKSRESHQA